MGVVGGETEAVVLLEVLIGPHAERRKHRGGRGRRRGGHSYNATSHLCIKQKKKHNPNPNAHDVNGPTKAVAAVGDGGAMTVQLELPAAIKMRHGKIYNLI